MMCCSKIKRGYELNEDSKLTWTRMMLSLFRYTFSCRKLTSLDDILMMRFDR